jgi:nitrate reductase gamma subunit
MSIGAGIVLIVIGAILAFAVNVQVPWIDLDLIGYILMGAGVVVVIIGIALLARRRTSTSVTRTSADPTGQERITERSMTADDDPRI